MLMITETLGPKGLVLRIDGRLTAEELPVLDKTCREIGRPYVLDLSGLQSADAAGSEKLRELAAGGVELRGASPYVQLLIDDSG